MNNAAPVSTPPSLRTRLQSFMHNNMALPICIVVGIALLSGLSYVTSLMYSQLARDEDQHTVDFAQAALQRYNHNVLSSSGTLPARINTIYRAADGSDLACSNGTYPTVTYPTDHIYDAVVACSGTKVTSNGDPQVRNPGIR